MSEKPTYKDKILSILKETQDWTPSYDLCKVDSPLGWIGSSGDRIARFMVDPRSPFYVESVERKDQGKYAFYRIRPGDKQLTLIQ